MCSLSAPFNTCLAWCSFFTAWSLCGTNVPSFPSTLLSLCTCVNRAVHGGGGVCLRIIPIPKWKSLGVFAFGVSFFTKPLSRVEWHPVYV